MNDLLYAINLDTKIKRRISFPTLLFRKYLETISIHANAIVIYNFMCVTRIINFILKFFSSPIKILVLPFQIELDDIPPVRRVRFLLRRGSDPNTVGIGGYTPLHTAAESNRVHNAVVLFEYGAIPNVRAQV